MTLKSLRTVLGIALFFVLPMVCAVTALAQNAVPAETAKPRLVIQTGHGNYINCVAFSPDGKTVASGSPDNTIKLWDVETGRELRTLTGHGSWVNSVAFSVDRRTLASGSGDNTIKLWDISTGRELRTLRGHTGFVYSVVFSADGKTLISGSHDKTIKVWDVMTGHELRTLNGHENWVESVALSPDGMYLASGSHDKTIKVWDVAKGQLLHTLSGHQNYIFSVAFSPDGKTIVSGSADNSVKLWDALAGRELQTLTGHREAVSSVQFSPDGKMVASGSKDKTIKLWDIETGRELSTLTGHGNGVMSVQFSPDGKTVASASWDQTIKLWDIKTGRELRTLTGHGSSIQSVVFSPNGKTIAIGNFDNTINLCDATTGHNFHTLTGHDGIVSSVQFSPDGKMVASGSKDKTIKLWDIETGRELRTLTGHKSGVVSVAFSPNGKMIASGGRDKTIKMWDVETGRELRTLTGHGEDVISVVFSPDGKILASGSHDLSIKLWDVETGRELRTLTGHKSGVVSVAFSLDGKMIASGSPDNTIKLWDVGTGRELRTLTGHGGGVYAVAFSPNGKILASGSADQTIKLWDAVTGRELYALTEHRGAVSSVAFSPDSNAVVSGSQDKTIKLWNAATGQLLCTLFSGDENDWIVVDPVGRYDASPDGTKALHYVVGMTPIDFEQLKDGFYEPGLLAKVMAFNKEPLRRVPSLDDLKLFPEVALKPPAPGESEIVIRLRAQNGGIGKVQVFINGKEFAGDARGITADGRGLTADARVINASVPITADGRGDWVSMRVNLDGPQVLPGADNEIRVVAYNENGDLASRGTVALWHAPGITDNGKPRLFAIIGGSSDYGDATKIKSLKFAAKDARDMAQAIALGARELFGVENVQMRLLTGETQPAKGDFPRVDATKANFQRAFEEVAKSARPQDYVVVYLAGHGTTIGQGNSDYRYLTQEAATPDLAHSPFLNQWTISADELTDWTLKIKARKQLVILDTCASGAAGGKLFAMRGSSSDAKRAIERAKDRAGLYVLMGSAPDAVSYEANQYNQGLLTYALLEGMSGRALREEHFVDVSQLFHYAEDRVPQLAGNVGGIQKPEVAAPRAQSFDFGKLTDEDKKRIPLKLPQPMVSKPILADAKSEFNDDTLNLSARLHEALREVSKDSEKGGGMVYVESDRSEVPGTLAVRGKYAITGDTVSVSIALLRDDGTQVGEVLKLDGRKTDLPTLAHQLAMFVRMQVAGVPAEAPLPRAEVKKNAEPARGPQSGEIALRGMVQGVDTKANRLVLRVNSFALPGGKESTIAPKDKTIVITTQTAWHGADFNTLKIGFTLEAIGPDGGSGKELTARLIVAR